MKVIARILAVLSLALGDLSLFRVRTPAALLIPKVVAAAPALYVVLAGLIGATLGASAGPRWPS